MRCRKSKLRRLQCCCSSVSGWPFLHWQATRGSEFGGADGAAEEAISSIDPDYEPWAESLIELPGERDRVPAFLPANGHRRGGHRVWLWLSGRAQKIQWQGLGINLRKRPDLSSLSSYLLYLLFCTRSRTVARPGGVGAVWSFSPGGNPL